jgi:PAS domain S-box-containing protein
MNRMAPPFAMAETLLADSLAGILVYEGHSGNCILANQAAADLLGGSVGALRLQNFRALASWRRAGLDNLAEAVLLDGLSKHHEVTLRTDFGKIVSLVCYISRFAFEGRPHLMFIVTDITERERAQAKLARERALLRCLIDSVSDLIFIKDRDGVYQGCNKAGEAFIGMPECEQIGKTDVDFFGRERAEQIRQADCRVLEEGNPLRVEEWVTGRDGRRLLMDTIKAPYYDPGGEALGLVGIGRDITERKLAEQELNEQLHFLQQLLDSIPIPVYYKDPEGIYLGCNAAFEAFTGLVRKDIVGKTVHEVVPKERADKHHEVDLALLSQPGMQTYEVGGIFKDGRHHDVIFSKATFVDANDCVAGTVGALMDITERKLAERERLANLRFFENMDRVNRAIQGADELEAMMRDLLDVVLAVFDCDRSFLQYPCDPEAPTWNVPMERNKPEHPGVRDLQRETPMDPQVAEALRVLLAADGPVTFGPGSPYALSEDASEQFNIKSVMSMAIYPKIGSPWQFGIQQCDSARIWTAEEKRLFQEIGRRLTDGLSTMLAEKALRESEKKLREAARIAHVGYWERDFVAQTIVLSEEACKIFGLPPHHGLPGLSEWHEQWVKLIHPEDQHQAAQAAAAALAGGPPYNVNYRLVRSDGRVRWVHSYAEVTRDASGNPLRMFGTMIDITERRQAEEKMLRSDQRLRLHREQSPLGFLEWDENFHAIEWNAACERIFGYTREEAIGRHAKDLILPVEAHELVDGIFHGLMNQAGGQHSINENVTKDGRIIICEWFNTTLVDKDGKATGVASICHDITEQKRMEIELAGYREHLEEQVKERTAELEERQEQIIRLNRDLRNRAAALEAANKDLDAFAYTVSHDLRAPLRHLDGFVELLQKRAGATLDEKSRHYMDTIAGSAQKMGLLIDDLLAFSRMGRQVMAFKQVNLGTLVRDVIRELEPETAGRNITWRIGDLPAVKGDASLLRIVLENLISNAVKFTRSNGQARIEVGCQSREKESIIFVRDNGAGFDPAYAGKLFGVFQRLHHKDEFEGTGVGLAIVQRIVIRHGGRTWAEGQVGHGATFYFSLPWFDGGER